MAMVTLTSDHLSGALSSENNNHLLSSYINCSEERFVLKPTEESRSPISTITLQHQHLHLGRNKAEDGEISVFGAEKYFSGGMDEENPGIGTNGGINSHHGKDDEGGDKAGPAKLKIQGRTPSVHSESSWNSQSALLLNALRNPPRKKTNKRQGRNLLASLGCNCSCLDQNSVDVDEQVRYQNSKGSSSCGDVRMQTVITKEPVQNGLDTVDVAQMNKSRLDNPWAAEEMNCRKIDEVGLGLKREDYFSFPILNSKLGNLAVKARLEEKENDDDDDKQRKSLEVFGSPVLQKKKKSLSLERRFTMLEEAEIPGMYVNDTASDASSDLFEIESFTNNSNSNSNSNSFLQRQASDGTSSWVTQTTHYAPSEASIEWSVVTASAADFSVVSDSEDPIYSSSAKPQKTAPNAKYNEVEKRHSGIMLGCKSHRAVNVAEDAYRTNGKAFPEPRRNHRSERFLPGTRFQTKTGF